MHDSFDEVADGDQDQQRTERASHGVAVANRPAPHMSPPLPRVYIRRPQLWERLDRATESAVTLLVAPGGAGKTLGVSGWLRATTAPQADDAVWVQADADLAAVPLELLVTGASANRAERQTPR